MARRRDRFRPGQPSRARRRLAWRRRRRQGPLARPLSSVAAGDVSAILRPMPAAVRPISGKPGTVLDLYKLERVLRANLTARAIGHRWLFGSVRPPYKHAMEVTGASVFGADREALGIAVGRDRCVGR